MTNNSAAKKLNNECKYLKELEETQLKMNKMRKNMLARDERNVALEKTCRMLETHLNSAHDEISQLKELIARMVREQARSDEMLQGERP